mmetsp:Transcript_39700/g.38260  ORF Transcript_39700/g.38260 Transcript_39700/m.38260 type:complete len:204 (+) Transcript_39700:421-1032(+)
MGLGGTTMPSCTARTSTTPSSASSAPSLLRALPRCFATRAMMMCWTTSWGHTWSGWGSTSRLRPRPRSPSRSSTWKQTSTSLSPKPSKREKNWCRCMGQGSQGWKTWATLATSMLWCRSSSPSQSSLSATGTPTTLKSTFRIAWGRLRPVTSVRWQSWWKVSSAVVSLRRRRQRSFYSRGSVRRRRARWSMSRMGSSRTCSRR